MHFHCWPSPWERAGLGLRLLAVCRGAWLECKSYHWSSIAAPQGVQMHSVHLPMVLQLMDISNFLKKRKKLLLLLHKAKVFTIIDKHRFQFSNRCWDVIIWKRLNWFISTVAAKHQSTDTRPFTHRFGLQEVQVNIGSFYLKCVCELVSGWAVIKTGKMTKHWDKHTYTHSNIWRNV